jgi:hypothetical protein
LSDKAIKVLLPVTSYLCETGLSSVAVIKKKSIWVDSRKGTASCHFIIETAIW